MAVIIRVEVWTMAAVDTLLVSLLSSYGALAWQQGVRRDRLRPSTPLVGGSGTKLLFVLDYFTTCTQYDHV